MPLSVPDCSSHQAADLAVFENLVAKATGEVQRTEKTSAEQLAAAADQVAALPDCVLIWLPGCMLIWLPNMASDYLPHQVAELKLTSDRL